MDGSPKPGKDRLSALDRERRVEFAADALLKHNRRSQVIDAICQEFGIRWRQAENYIRQARERILTASRASKETHKAEAVDFYLAIINNHTAPLRERLKARRHLDLLLGLPAPIKHEIETPGLNAEDVVKALMAAKKELNE